VKSGGYKFLTEDLVIFINFIKNYHGNWFNLGTVGTIKS
jgi:hypothetical protein